MKIEAGKFLYRLPENRLGLGNRVDLQYGVNANKPLAIT